MCYNVDMSNATTFTRIWGPDETEIAGDDSLFELTSSYRGEVNSKG